MKITREQTRKKLKVENLKDVESIKLELKTDFFKHSHKQHKYNTIFYLMNFSRIKKYSFTAQNIHKLMTNECVEIRKEITKKKVIPSNKIINNDFFIPPEKDSLFWCWIIFNYGFYVAKTIL